MFTNSSSNSVGPTLPTHLQTLIIYQNTYFVIQAPLCFKTDIERVRIAGKTPVFFIKNRDFVLNANALNMWDGSIQCPARD